MCTLRDLRVHAPIIFENLRIIYFTVENKYGEKTIPIKTVNRLLEKIATDDLIFDGIKVVCFNSSIPLCLLFLKATHKF